jgi:hypothetical protein
MSLLLDNPKSRLPGVLAKLQAATAANRIPGGYRLDEANTFFLGGAPNVSDAHGSALWAVDFLLTAARYGSAGVNFHGGANGNYNPPYTPLVDKNGAVIDVRPVYYGMLLVAHIAAGPMYGVHIAPQLNLSAYAIAGSDGATYVVILNKHPGDTALTYVDFGAPASYATALALTGPSRDSLTGTVLGGGRVAADGAWSPRHKRSLNLRGNELTIQILPASAVLLKVT